MVRCFQPRPENSIAMSMKLDAEIKETGTRFRIFPQPRYLRGFEEPETVVISVAPSEVQTGPADTRMYCVDAIGKPIYGRGFYPPYQGPKNNPPQPTAEGHYDNLHPDSREFRVATMYATVRRVLDIWEDYFGSDGIPWHFRLHYDRMELVPLVEWDNAHSGYGFLEFGYGRDSFGDLDMKRPYCENFDVLAHELGHSVVFSQVGIPSQSSNTAQYGGMHEASGDLVALVAGLHFDKVVDHLLQSSAGNLFTENELSRIGELSKTRQIRKAFNYERMSTVGSESHDLSKPLTGAVFDILVESYQQRLVKAGKITQKLADRAYASPGYGPGADDIHRDFRQAYEGSEGAFKSALLEARDYVGDILATTWKGLSPHYLTYVDFGTALLDADRALGGKHQTEIRENFAWREILLPADSIALTTHQAIHED